MTTSDFARLPLVGSTRALAQPARLAGFAVFGFASLLAACTPEGQDMVARETAKSVINPILAQRFPGVPLAPISNCVIDNATGPEIVTIASAAVTGVTPTTTQTTVRILQRPATIDCIARQGLRGGFA